MTTSLYLSPATNDITLDASGSLAVCAEPYRIAQDAATAIKTYRGECVYDATLGIPYWTEILGKAPPIELMRSYFTQAALAQVGAVSARVYLQSLPNRGIGGQVQITDANGSTSFLSF